MTWHHVEIGGKSADVFEPASPSRFNLLWLHDRDGTTPPEVPEGFTVVCPIAPRTWWCGESARHILDDVIPWMRSTGKPFAIAGVGMGGQGALRLAFQHPEAFPVVAAIDAAIDHYEWYGRGTELDAMYASKERCRQDSATLHVHPARQPRFIWFGCDPASEWFRGNDRLREKLFALGVSHRADLESSRPAIDWDFVVAGLEQIQRSLI